MRTGWIRRSGASKYRICRAQQVDLIHTNTILTPEGGFAARQLALPHVWHLREMLGSGQPFPFVDAAASELRRYIQRHASMVVANSNIAAATAGDSIPPGMLRIVPNGIDLRAFAPRGDAAAAGRPRDRSDGRSRDVAKWKKHAVFIEAAGKLTGARR